MHRRTQLIAAACAACAALGGHSGLAAGGDDPAPKRQRAAELELVNRPADRFNRAIDAHLEYVAERRERRRARKHREAAAVIPTPESVGVSQATLDAIAACESGGDPTAVNPAGYYGKYQFDLGTWASVGGSGSPAEASEAEQDYRAALLYSRAGSSPWPVCGV